jgi:hypothetical protein
MTPTKQGRPKGIRRLTPQSASVRRIVACYDKHVDGVPRYRSTGEIAKATGCTSSHVLYTLNRWRPDWRARFHGGMQ